MDIISLNTRVTHTALSTLRVNTSSPFGCFFAVCFLKTLLSHFSHHTRPAMAEPLHYKQLPVEGKCPARHTHSHTHLTSSSGHKIPHTHTHTHTHEIPVERAEALWGRAEPSALSDRELAAAAAEGRPLLYSTLLSCSPSFPCPPLSSPLSYPSLSLSEAERKREGSVMGSLSHSPMATEGLLIYSLTKEMCLNQATVKV